MHWITGLIGAFFGASLGEAGVGFLGAVVGLMLGWHFGRHLKWSARLKAVEDKLVRLEGRAAAEAARAAGRSGAGRQPAPAPHPLPWPRPRRRSRSSTWRRWPPPKPSRRA
jgi:hypothetical protein